MVLRLRGSARTVSAVLVVLSLWTLPHSSQPDICLPAGTEEHDASRHVYTAGSKAADDEHCAVCHWMRSLKPAFTSRPLGAADNSRSVAVLVQAGRGSFRSAVDHLSPRAPPAE